MVPVALYNDRESDNNAVYGALSLLIKDSGPGAPPSSPSKAASKAPSASTNSGDK